MERNEGEMLKIGSLAVEPPLFLAPMAGVTDRDFRLIVRRIGGVGVVAMEFISSRNLVHGQPTHRRRERELLQFVDEERPLAIQVYGSDAETMAAAAREVETLRPDLCDVNMGCPANKVLKNCSGAALMGDLRMAAEIVRRVRREVSMPLTVKFRLGLDEVRMSYLELARICEAEGADAVVMHARTAKQGYGGRADWEHIARLKESVGIPVIGNGDVRSPEDGARMMAETGCDGVMIGRAATRNPWIFAQTAARLGAGSGPEAGPLQEPSVEDRRELILGHFRTVVERDEPGVALDKLRRFTGWYSHGLPGGRALRRQINDLPKPESFLRAVEEHFAEVEQTGGDTTGRAAA